MKFYYYLLVILFLYLISGLYYSNLDSNIVVQNTAISFDETPEFYDYSGVLNVHSRKSTGSASIQDIIKVANDTDLDFIIFNEESPLGRKEPPSINYGGLSVFYGLELPYKNTSILYVDPENNKTFTTNSEIQIFLSDYFVNGGDEFVVLAHPERLGYEWKEDVPDKITGIEILNLREVWRTAWNSNKFLFLKALVFYPFNSDLFFLNIYSDASVSRDLWDKWNLGQAVFGYLGSDVNSKLRLGEKFIRFPSYKSIFKMAKNHIVVNEELTSLQKDKLIFKALAEGSSYFSIDIFGNPSGFIFYALTNSNKKLLMGSSVQKDKVKELAVNLPKTKVETKVLLFKDSKLLKKSDREFKLNNIQAGVYRVEVHLEKKSFLFSKKKWVPWVISNAITVTEP